MPVIHQSNNRILPNNSRNVDVATKAIQEISPVEQQRYMNVFRVQGYAGILYTRLHNGVRCTCQSSRQVVNSILNKQGKASPGAINEILTGSQFGIAPYGEDAWNNVNPNDPNITSPQSNGNLYRGTFDLRGKTQEYPNQEISQIDIGDIEDFGDNGPIQEFDLDDIVQNFDTMSSGFSDAACPICFGTGYVNGYLPFNTYRQVLVPNSVSLIDSETDVSQKPWTCNGTGFSTSILLPRVLNIDAFNLWNYNEKQNFSFTIDGVNGDYPTLVSKFDGKQHSLMVNTNGPWTHFEIQFNVSDNSMYFELPKLTKSSDLSLLQQMEPFQVLLSPNIPKIEPEDIIVESTFGHALMVQGVPWWNTRNRRVMGWECQVRVCQPQEIYTLLPKRGRVAAKNRTTNAVRDNQRGLLRT